MEARQAAEQALIEGYRSRTARSAALYEEAVGPLPGGDTRTGTFFLPYPTFMAEGRGARLWDEDGNEYVDFLNNFTSLIHGHAHPAVTAAIAEQSARGTAHGFPGSLQVRLAAEIRRRLPSMEKLRFCNSGTEAVMGAIRAARAFAGRPKILKMEGAYHGTYDAALVSMHPPAEPPPYPAGVPDGPGLSPGLTGEVMVAPFNDLDAVSELVRRHRDELAAVILEPAMTAAGTIAADPEFLRGVREVTRDAGVLLIIDEIITLRLSPGGGQGLYGVTPDLTTVAKIIGGGLPVGAFGGRADIMALWDPRQPGAISHSGTFNGNAATMAAGLATLEVLTDAELERLNGLGARLRDGLAGVLGDAGLDVTVLGLGSLAHVHFRGGPIRSYRDAASAPRWASRLLHLGLLNRGYVSASRGMFVASTAMTESDVDGLVEAAGEAGASVAEAMGEVGIAR